MEMRDPGNQHTKARVDEASVQPLEQCRSETFSSFQAEKKKIKINLRVSLNRKEEEEEKNSRNAPLPSFKKKPKTMAPVGFLENSLGKKKKRLLAPRYALAEEKGEEFLILTGTHHTPRSLAQLPSSSSSSSSSSAIFFSSLRIFFFFFWVRLDDADVYFQGEPMEFELAVASFVSSSSSQIKTLLHPPSGAPCDVTRQHLPSLEELLALGQDAKGGIETTRKNTHWAPS